MFDFYTAFGRDLSDTTTGNTWYTEYCERKQIGIRNSTELDIRSLIPLSACPKLPEQLEINGRDVGFTSRGWLNCRTKYTSFLDA